METARAVWPELNYAGWRETAATLQLWIQIVAKVRLTLTPWLNHGWRVPLYVTASGLGTSPIPAGCEILELEFDFISHRLVARTSRGEEVYRFWRALVKAPPSLQTVSCRQDEPVHFFWASFNLAVTRLFGKAPRAIPGLPDAVTRETYSHEVSSAGLCSQISGAALAEAKGVDALTRCSSRAMRL